MNATTTKPELVIVDPATVLLEANVRTGAEISAEFIDSIKTHGVMTPVLGRRDADGILHIRAGQRRTLAAREAGVELPVIIVDVAEGETEPEWERIAQQIVENEHRSNLTSGQKVAAYRALELEGLSVTKIAGTLSAPKEQVKAALTISKTERTLAIANSYDIDLMQLAALSEFEDDVDTLEELTTVAVEEPEQLEHALSAARLSRDQAKEQADYEATLRAEGTTVYTTQDLRDGKVVHANGYKLDKDFTPEPESGTGTGVIVARQYNGTFYLINVLEEPEAHGYKPYNSGSGASGPMTDEQKEERRRVIRCNKAWDATESVRAEWLKTFLSRKAFPKDSGQFIITSLLRYAFTLNSHTSSLAHDLLGIEQKHGYETDALADLVDEQPNKAGLVTLALILGKFEQSLSRNTWRHPDKASRAYLLQLREWGYTLAPVELIAVGEAQDVPHDEDDDFAADLVPDEAEDAAAE